MEFTSTTIAGLWIIDPVRHTDERGYFARTLCQREVADHGIDADVRQINTSLGYRAGTFRGLHAQCPPHGETKIVRCVAGSMFDVVVDLRPESDTFGATFTQELSADNGRALVVPARCAHGFLTLVDHTVALYTVSEFHVAGQEVGLTWNDPAIDIAWPLTPEVVSSKDRSWPMLAAQRDELLRRMTV